MNDFQSIHNAIMRYAWLFDFGDVSQVGSAFTEGCRVTFSDSGTFDGRAEAAEHLIERRRRYGGERQPFHFTTNVYIDRLEGDEAEVKTLWMHLITGDRTFVPRFGYYDDILRRVGDEWLIERRSIKAIGVYGTPTVPVELFGLHS